MTEEKAPGECSLLLSLTDQDQYVYDQDDNIFVITTDKAGNKIIISPDSKKYHAILSDRFFTRYNTVPKQRNMKEVVLLKRGETTTKINLFVRVAGEQIGTKNAVIYYDMCNDADAIEIKPHQLGEHVKIISRPLKFKDTGKCGQQVKPNLNANIADAKKFYDHIKIKPPVFDSEQQFLSEESIEKLMDKERIVERRKKVLLAWCVFNLIPDTVDYKLVRPGIKITGAPGSAKTMNSVKILAVPDPVAEEISSKPKEIESFELALYQRWIPAFDNVNEVTQQESDDLCTAATGIKITKRMRYTDSDTLDNTFRRSCLINGVSDVLTRPDAADRYIPIELQRLEPSEYKSDGEVLKSFMQDMPDIFGACLKLLSATLYRLAYDHSKPKMGHRLISFLEISRIVSEILDYHDNIKNINGIILMPEYDLIVSNSVIMPSENEADDLESEFIQMMTAQETSMVDSNVVASSILSYIITGPEAVVDKFSIDGWSKQISFKQFRDDILKDMAKRGLDKEQEYKQLQSTDIKKFKRELMTFLKNMASSGVEIKIIEPTPGIKTGASATYRLKYRKIKV